MCVFCDKTVSDDFISEKESCIAFYDSFPVSKYHVLIVPKRHVESFFSLTDNERNDILQLASDLKEEIEYMDSSITGWNIGFNCGESAGQTVFHCHCHLIPRRKNDCENPIGGVRGCIPHKMNYVV